LAKDKRTSFSDRYLSFVYEIRNNIVAGIGFIATIILGLAAMESISSDTNPVFDILRINLITILDIDIAIAVAFFIGLNRFHFSLAKRFNKILFGSLEQLGSINQLKHFIINRSVKLKFIRN
jgi:hypothetical protein